MASHDINQGSIRTILFSIKMITPSYGFTLLQVSKSQKPSPPPQKKKNSSNCCSISHALNCLLHNLKRHYHVQRSFSHLPIRGQTNPVHISHSFYTRATPKLTPPILLCWPTTQEANVVDMAVEVEPSRQYSVKFCCRVTDDSKGAI